MSPSHSARRSSLRALLTGSLLALSSLAAPAALSVTIQEEGSGLRVNWSGSVDLSLGFFLFNTSDAGTVVLSTNTVTVAGVAGQFYPTSEYALGSTLSAGSFPFMQLTPTSGSGDFFSVLRGTGRVIVPQGYVNGAPLSGTAFVADTSFADVGLAGGESATLRLNGLDDANTITTTALVPEPGTVLLGLIPVVVAVTRRRRERA